MPPGREESLTSPISSVMYSPRSSEGSPEESFAGFFDCLSWYLPSVSRGSNLGLSLMLFIRANEPQRLQPFFVKVSGSSSNSTCCPHNDARRSYISSFTPCC